MLKPYKIIDIVHSGRKGIRGKRVTAEKYNDVIGSVVLFDVDKVKQFESVGLLFENHPIYNYWTTSEVWALSTDPKEKIVNIETANSIYILKLLS